MAVDQIRLAIIATHPVQYQTPWFTRLASDQRFILKVFYLWNPELSGSFDQGFRQKVEWDLPLLQGYSYEFIENQSRDPGTHHFLGLQNQALPAAIQDFGPNAALFLCYNYLSVMRMLFLNKKLCPYLFRGDSHRLLEESGWRAGIKRRLIKTIFSRFDAFLYVGKSNHDYFKHHGVADKKLFFCPHAIDQSRFELKVTQREQAREALRNRLGISSKSRMVLIAGKFEEKKRPLDLLEAFIKSNLEDTSLLFVGAGAQELQLQSRAEGHSNIFFLPFQNQSQIPEIYAAADLFVLPSAGKYETWGVAVNEAQAARVPVVVSSHVGSAQDLVQDGVSGFLFEAGNVESLKLTLVRAFESQQSWFKMSRTAAEGLRKFSYDQMTKGLASALYYVKKESEKVL